MHLIASLHTQLSMFQLSFPWGEKEASQIIHCSEQEFINPLNTQQQIPIGLHDSSTGFLWIRISETRKTAWITSLQHWSASSSTYKLPALFLPWDNQHSYLFFGLTPLEPSSWECVYAHWWPFNTLLMTMAPSCVILGFPVGLGVCVCGGALSFPS